MPIAAAIQMSSTPDWQSNRNSAAKLIQQAANSGAKLAVLPEMFPIMDSEPSEMLKLREVFGNGPIQDFMAEEAAKNNIWLVGGTIPIAVNNSPRVYSTCFIYNNLGKQVAHYNKIHLFDVIVQKGESYKESQNINPGNDLTVVDTPIGKIGIAVCYDLRFPELFRKYCNLGVEIFVLPAAFTLKTGQAHWDILTRCRCIENLCYGIFAGQSGQHTANKTTYGHSMIVNPWGEVLNILESGEGIVISEIDLKKLEQVRRDFPSTSHQKLFSTQ